jgi:hypothetical protein
MQRSSSTPVFFGHVGFTQRMRCFFHASDMGCRRRASRVAHDRTLLDLGPRCPRRPHNDTGHLFDHRLDAASAPFVTQDSHVFEAHQGGEDLSTVDDDEGASRLLAHTSRLKRFRLFLGDPGHPADPR